MKPTHARQLNVEEKKVLRLVMNFLKECYPFEIQTDGPQLRFGFVPALAPAFRDKLTGALAERMVTGVLALNAKTWREAARQSTEGQRIFEALKSETTSSVNRRVAELIAENQGLINSLPDRIAARAQQWIVREQRSGRRAEDLARELRQRLPEWTKAQVATFARTGVSRAETELTRARAERLNLNWYEWNTSRDERVRESHREMESVLVHWDDPPSPEALVHQASSLGHYHAGETYNCRCLALPLLTLDEVKWPHRVYTGGHIERMTRAQFKRLLKQTQAA